MSVLYFTLHTVHFWEFGLASYQLGLTGIVHGR
jgi:hypothetical protein